MEPEPRCSSTGASQQNRPSVVCPVTGKGQGAVWGRISAKTGGGCLLGLCHLGAAASLVLNCLSSALALLFHPSLAPASGSFSYGPWTWVLQLQHLHIPCNWSVMVMEAYRTKHWPKSTQWPLGQMDYFKGKPWFCILISKWSPLS